MNTTVRIKASQIYKDWHVIDAAGRPLGRVASEAAILLRGKHKPTYEPHLDDGDFVIIINAGQVKMTGRKAEQNKYYTHSGFPGGLRTRTFADQFARYPERVVEKSVWGMLPGGTLGEAMLKHLKVYRGAHHPHQSQITGSERAQAARAEALAATIGEPKKAPRLRKLSVPVVVEAPEPKVKAVVAAPAKPAAVKPKRGKAPAEAVAATEAAAEAIQAETGVVTTTGATPAEAAIEAEKKPRRTTKAATAEAPATEATEEAPKPRARRKAAEPAAEVAATTDAPKLARKRATPKTEE